MALMRAAQCGHGNPVTLTVLFLFLDSFVFAVRLTCQMYHGVDTTRGPVQTPRSATVLNLQKLTIQI